MENYEQKYKEALEQAKVVNPGTKDYNIVTTIFPELKKSEDELIREELIHFLKTCRDPRFVGSRKQDEWIEWLEKQSKTALDSTNEEKVDNTNKVEPRFKAGDWVVNRVGMVNQIINDWGDGYTLDNNVYLSDSWSTKHYRLWTVKDAKDGDILICSAQCHGEKIEQVGIFKEYVGRHGGCSNSFKIYAGIDWDKHLLIDSTMGSSEIHPATEKQQDLFFQKIKESGYIWDGGEHALYQILKVKIT